MSGSPVRGHTAAATPPRPRRYQQRATHAAFTSRDSIMNTARPLTPTAPASAGDKTRLTDKQRQAIGVSALLLCLLIGVGVIWWFFYGSAPTQRKITVDPKEQSIGQIENRGIRNMRPPRMITRLDANTWL